LYRTDRFVLPLVFLYRIDGTVYTPLMRFGTGVLADHRQYGHFQGAGTIRMNSWAASFRVADQPLTSWVPTLQVPIRAMADS
jgi:hypothetical protein